MWVADQPPTSLAIPWSDSPASSSLSSPHRWRLSGKIHALQCAVLVKVCKPWQPLPQPRSFCLSKQDEPGLQWGCTAQANNWVTSKFNQEKTIVSSPVTQSFPIYDLTQNLACSGDSPAGWNTAMLIDWPGGVFSQWRNSQVGNFRSHLWRFRVMRWWHLLLWTSSGKNCRASHCLLPAKCLFPLLFHPYCVKGILLKGSEHWKCLVLFAGPGVPVCYKKFIKYPKGFTFSSFKSELIGPVMTSRGFQAPNCSKKIPLQIFRFKLVSLCVSVVIYRLYISPRRE